MRISDWSSDVCSSDLRMSQEMSQPVIVENRPGSNGNLAASYVSRATADGHTLLLAYSGSHVANPSLFPTLGWDHVESFETIGPAVQAPPVIVVRTIGRAP